MPQIRIWIILFLLLTTSISQAQDENDSRGWDIVERCVGESVEPSDDWTYDGTILLANGDGVHNLSTDKGLVLQVPNNNWMLPIPRSGLGLSPNGVQFTTIQFETVYSEEFERNLRVPVNLLVYDLQAGTSQVYPVTSETYAAAWLTDENILIESDRSLAVLYISSGGLEPFVQFNNNQSSTLLYHFYPTQNGDRAFFLDDIFRIEWRIVDLVSGNIVAAFEASPQAVGEWSPDGTHFIFQVEPVVTYYLSGIVEYQDTGSLVLFNRNGGQEEVVFSFARSDTEPKFLRETQGWSPDGRYYAFAPIEISNSLEVTTNLHLIDFEANQVVNLCVEVSENGLAWSSDSKKMAFVINTFPDSRIMIFDFDRWQIYSVDNYDGHIIGWREDPE